MAPAARNKSDCSLLLLPSSRSPSICLLLLLSSLHLSHFRALFCLKFEHIRCQNIPKKGKGHESEMYIERERTGKVGEGQMSAGGGGAFQKTRT